MEEALPVRFNGPQTVKNPAFVAFFKEYYSPNGLPGWEIAKILKISPSRVSRIAKKLGLQRDKGAFVSAGMKRSRGCRHKIDDTELQRLWPSHLPNWELVEHFGCKIETLRARAKALGLGRRIVPAPHLRSRTPERQALSCDDGSIEARLRATGGRWAGLAKIAAEQRWTCSQAQAAFHTARAGRKVRT